MGGLKKEGGTSACFLCVVFFCYSMLEEIFFFFGLGKKERMVAFFLLFI